MQLNERGEQFLQRWQETFAATDEEWLEISLVYEWAVRLQAAQTNGRPPYRCLCCRNYALARRKS